jgi:uncharacterized membrane protein YuzA (DUF378 family)
MTLLSIFWILIGVNFLVLIAIRFGFGKDLMTTIFWILVGVNVLTLLSILWYGKY